MHADGVSIAFSEEGNWRNDYPDEQDSLHSSESEENRENEHRHWDADYGILLKPLHYYNMCYILNCVV